MALGVTRGGLNAVRKLGCQHPLAGSVDPSGGSCASRHTGGSCVGPEEGPEEMTAWLCWRVCLGFGTTQTCPTSAPLSQCGVTLQLENSS